MAYKFKEALVQAINNDTEYGLMLSFEGEEGQIYRHAVRIAVGDPAEPVLSGLHGFLEYIEVKLK